MPRLAESLRKIPYLFFGTVCMIFGLGMFAGNAQAASLYLSPASGTYTIRQNFTVNVNVASADQAMNALSGTVSFPTDRLQVASISKGGSIMSLWVAEPSFSNSAGTISFEGVVLNPGYKGSGGRVLSITFRGTKLGPAAVRFSGGQILANDGQGTDITKGLGGGTYTINPEKEKPPVEKSPEKPPEVQPPEPVVTGVPGMPVIRSSTHPSSDTWYLNRDLIASWDLPAGVKGVSVSVDNNTNTTPVSTLDQVTSTISIPQLEDGIWYVHLRLKNAMGWSPLAHFRVQIDGGVPNLILKELPTDRLAPTAKFQIQATDSASGIARHELQIDGGQKMLWKDPGTHLYMTDEVDIGKHTLSVTVTDLAGNTSTKSADFFIQTACPASAQPQIDINWLMYLLLVIIVLLLLLVIILVVLYLHTRNQIAYLKGLIQANRGGASPKPDPPKQP
ncbi:MAG: hypothetical protein Q7R83_01680 [bacterium]|nr:hypothetical protein [bacterium]